MHKSLLGSLLGMALMALLLSACGQNSATATPIPTRATAGTRAASPAPAVTRGTPTAFGAFVTVTPFSADQPTFSVPTLVFPTARPGETIPPTFTPAPFVTVTPFPTAAPGNRGPIATPTLRVPTLRPGENTPRSVTLAPFETVTPQPIQVGTLSAAQLTQTAAAPTGSASATDYSAPPPPPNTTALFPAGCSAFTLDKAASGLFALVKADIPLVWGTVPEATSYHIWVRHPDGSYNVNQEAKTNRLTLNGISGGRVVFNVPGVYAFEIVAYRNLEPICAHITDIIVVSQ